MGDDREECPKCANAAQWYGEHAMCYDHLMSDNAKLQGQIDAWNASAMSLRALVVSTWTHEDLSGDEGETSWAREMEGSLLLKAINNSIALINDGKIIEGGD